MTTGASKDRPPLAARARARATSLGASVLKLGHTMLDHPLWTLAILVPIALAIELAQYRPEIYTGGHAVSEVVRNITYGVIAAIIFEWLIVELPGRRRRQAVYEAYQYQLIALVTSGPLLLADYRLYRASSQPELDAWDQASLSHAAQAIAASNPTFFGRDRADDLRHSIEVARMALEDVRTSQHLLDPAVAQAISTFPINPGMGRLHVNVDANGNIPPALDVHIVWELMEASRRLYAALSRHAPTLKFTHAEKKVRKDGQEIMLKVQESDLVAPDS